MFRDVYNTITTGNDRWNKLMAPKGDLYPWDSKSTYIKNPPFFENMTKVTQIELFMKKKNFI